MQQHRILEKRRLAAFVAACAGVVWIADFAFGALFSRWPEDQIDSMVAMTIVVSMSAMFPLLLGMHKRGPAKLLGCIALSSAGGLIAYILTSRIFTALIAS